MEDLQGKPTRSSPAKQGDLFFDTDACNLFASGGLESLT
jgi:hypothetical protein